MEELPEGWTRTTLGEVCSHPQYGWTTSASTIGRGPKLVRTTDISKSLDWGSVPFCKDAPPDLEKYLLREGDILVSRAGSVGISHVVGEACPQAVFASYLIRFRPRGEVSSRYLGLYLQSADYWRAIAEESTGIAIPNVNASKLATLEIPLPPLAEQKRIVEKVEALLAQVQAVRDRLERVQQILKRFRQAVLAAEVCAGMPEVPDGWRSVTLGDLGAWYSGGTPSRKDATYFGGPVLWVKSGDLRDGLVERTEESITKQALQESAARLLPAGTVSIAMYGATIGRAGVLGLEASTNQACASCVVTEAMVDNWFLFYYLLSQREAFVRAGQGGAQPNISLTILKAWPLNLPPLSEQRGIVQRIERMLPLLGRIEGHIEKSRRNALAAPGAILGRAFAGELVPTEAEVARVEGRGYESGEELLARVRVVAPRGAERRGSGRGRANQGEASAAGRRRSR